MASLEELMENRLSKLKKLKDSGIDPYPIKSERTHTLIKLVEDFDNLSKENKTITGAGRIMSLRPQGSIFFFDLFDGTSKFQVVLKKDESGDEPFNLFSETVDIGDIIEATGTLFVTKRGEKSILAKNWTMLSKSLRPLPEKWHGLTDVEERFRKRYLDIISSEEVRDRIILRSKITKEIRNFLDNENFIEVETSMLQHLPGGANAEPFKTRHNALDIDLYLRIAQEIDLKKLLVANFPKIYELGRNFRNEGIDVTHNPEFTTVEWYEAFSRAEKQMDFIEKLYKHLVKIIFDSEKIIFDEKEINFGNKFERITYYDLLKKYAKINDPEKESKENLIQIAHKLGAKADKNDSKEKIFDAIYKKACRGELIQPTFIMDYPSNAIPLAKRKSPDSDTVDAFQLVVGGMEIVKAFSELNDPIDQANRFKKQEEDREAGDKEAQTTDADFLEALEHGMPPAGGVGLSIDRTSMIFGNVKNIREVIIFPTLKPKSKE